MKSICYGKLLKNTCRMKLFGEEKMDSRIVFFERMWCDIIKEYADKNIHNINDRSMSNENKLYLSLFRQWYEGYEYLIPYYWMPKWSEIDDDPSGIILGE